MTEHELEQRLRAWYRSEADQAADGAPAALRSSVGAIPYAEPMRRPWLGWNPFRTRRSLALAAALALLTVALAAGAAAVGSGLIRLPWETERSLVEPSAIDPCVLMRQYAREPVILDGGHSVPAAWGVATACATGYDDGWGANHLLWRTGPLSTAEAEALVRDMPYADSGGPKPAALTFIEAQSPAISAWSAVLVDDQTTPGVAPVFIVSYEPYFFIVTGTAWVQASAASVAVQQLDRLNAVASSVGFDPCSVDLAAGGFTWSSPTEYGVTPELSTCRFAADDQSDAHAIFVSRGPIDSPGNLDILRITLQNRAEWKPVTVRGHPALFTSCAPLLTDPSLYGLPGASDYGDRCPALIQLQAGPQFVLVTLYPGADETLAIVIAEQVLAGQ